MFFSNRVAIDNPDVEFLNASYLSDQDLVIDTFMERIQDVFNGENFMNCALCKYRSNLLGFENEVGYEQVSHHDHVEGCLDICPGNKSHDHAHDHFPYPHAEHPLGPVTLRSSNKSQI